MERRGTGKERKEKLVHSLKIVPTPLATRVLHDSAVRRYSLLVMSYPVPNLHYLLSVNSLLSDVVGVCVEPVIFCHRAGTGLVCVVNWHFCA